MMATVARTRLTDLASTISWHVRGLVETDAFRRVKFGLRALAQRDEYERRRAWAASLAAGADVDRDLGFRIDPLGASDVAAVCALGDELARALDADAAQTHRKAFHRNHLLPADRRHVLLAIALRDDVLRAVSRYLGVVPVLADLDFFCSLPTPDGTAWTSSQLYHCDEECPTQLKLFVYCDAVSPPDGPLEVVDAARSQMVRDRLRYRYAGRAYRVSDAAMDALVPAGDQHAIVGPRGTTVLLDTSRCFHRGSRIRQSDRKRMVAVIQFAPPNATHLPLRLDAGAPFRDLATPDMSPLARAVLGEPVA